METTATESLEKALDEMIADYKFLTAEGYFPADLCVTRGGRANGPQRFSDKEIRATASRHGVDACDLYAAFNAAIAAA
jgi:hypothetical protein